mmetsp:Transcript_22529/g.50347  ORF Transcript_22529/g.50347 Transcript_22529/m.50347 type:complete len:138 (-) Transcript_22529:381-794(-)
MPRSLLIMVIVTRDSSSSPSTSSSSDSESYSYAYSDSDYFSDSDSEDTTCSNCSMKNSVTLGHKLKWDGAKETYDDFIDDFKDWMMYSKLYHFSPTRSIPKYTQRERRLMMSWKSSLSPRERRWPSYSMATANALPS